MPVIILKKQDLSMRIRSIDSDRDWIFGQGIESYAVNQVCVSQNVRTKLLEFTNDCFFAMPAGVDWITLMRQKNRQNQIALSCRSVILKTEGVNRVTNMQIVQPAPHELFVFFDLTTIYSSKPLSQTEVVTI